MPRRRQKYKAFYKQAWQMDERKKMSSGMHMSEAYMWTWAYGSSQIFFRDTVFSNTMITVFIRNNSR